MIPSSRARRFIGPILVPFIGKLDPWEEPRRALVLLLVLLPALVAFFGWASVLEGRLKLHYPPAIPEHQSVFGIHSVIHGDPLYRDWRVETPVVPLTFGTLFYTSYGRVAGVLGDGSAQSLFRVGRILTLCFFVGLCVILFSAAPSGSYPRHAAGLVPILAITAFPYPAEWATKLLPDIAALFFGFLGWALARRGLEGSDWKPFVFLGGGIASWIVAFHYKPTLIHGEILFAAEAIQRVFLAGSSWKAAAQRLMIRCVPVGLLTIAGVVVSVSLVNSSTGGLWYLNQVESIAHRIKSTSFISQSIVLWRIGSSIALVGIFVIAIASAFRIPALAAFLIMIPFDLHMMRLQGSNVNHLLGSLVLAGIGLRHLVLILGSGDWKPSRFSGGVLAGGALALFVGLCITIPSSTRRTWEGTRESPRHIATITQMVEAAEPGRVLFLDAFIALSTGNTPLYADGYHAFILEEDGLDLFVDVAADILAGRYDLVVGNRMLQDSFYYHQAGFTPTSLFNAIVAVMEIEQIGSWLVVARPSQGNAP